MSKGFVYLALSACVWACVFVVARAETSTTTITVLPPAQCADGIDNDSDGLIDYPSDPGCDGLDDDDETDPSPPPPPTPVSGGGSSSMLRTLFSPSVLFSGLAFPNATIHILRDGMFFAENTADTAGVFLVETPSVSPGSYVFTVIAEQGGSRSMISFLAHIVQARSVLLGDIFIPPALTARLNGEHIVVSGVTVPEATLDFFRGASKTPDEQVRADTRGRFSFTFPAVEPFSVAVTASVGNAMSPLSSFVRPTTPSVVLRGDFNKDGRVNLVDFSILIFWYEQPNSPEAVDMSGDGRVTIEDVSILLFYWTG